LENAEGVLDGAKVPLHDVIERDGGMWSLGWHDSAAGPSETREFAAELNAASASREGDFEPSPHRVSEFGSPDLGPSQDDVTPLRYRLLRMSKHTRASRARAYRELMSSGWSQALLDKELDAALRWASSTVLAAEQQAEIKRRAVDRARISNDAALENMFAAVGVGRENIIKCYVPPEGGAA
jgi:hypothetical protein